LQNLQKNSMGENVRKYVTSAWYFEKWYEKIILIILGVAGFVRIIEFFI